MSPGPHTSSAEEGFCHGNSTHNGGFIEHGGIPGEVHTFLGLKVREEKEGRESWEPTPGMGPPPLIFN